MPCRSEQFKNVLNCIAIANTACLCPVYTLPTVTTHIDVCQHRAVTDMYRVHVSALTSDNVPIMVYPYIQSATYFIPSDVWAVPASNVLKTLSHSFYDAWWQWISCVYYHGPLDSVPSCNHSTLVTLLQIDFFTQWPHCAHAAFLGVWLTGHGRGRGQVSINEVKMNLHLLSLSTFNPSVI